jgi:uracil-DNA glycosylase
VDVRQQLMAVIKSEIVGCQSCEGMNVRGKTQAAPGYGSPWSPIVLVGQSLCGKPCMTAQIPFTGGSGRFLDLSFERAGIAKHEVFTTNVVHCHPPGNRASFDHEIENCRPYLLRELAIIQPRLVITLGKDAAVALRGIYPQARQLKWPFVVPDAARPETATVPDLLPVPHPSWVKYQHPERRDEYIDALARAISWGFA